MSVSMSSFQELNQCWKIIVNNWDILPAFKCEDSRLYNILKNSDVILRTNASDTSTLNVKLEMIYI
jgi:hypothetical protein